MVLTEDLGKMFEKAICLLYNIPFVGPYKYGDDIPTKLIPKIQKIVDLFPVSEHTAANGFRYDFKSADGKYLSAKTTKKDKKVCPQVIGQPTKKGFCESFGLPTDSSNDTIKEYISNNLKSMLTKYFHHTFECDIVYYNRNTDSVLYVRTKEPINWDSVNLDFSHIRKNKKWNESSTIYLVKNDETYTLGEFQVHKHRNCIKFRWNFENVLSLFPDNFEVTKF
jgi:hypothetical protein